MTRLLALDANVGDVPRRDDVSDGEERGWAVRACLSALPFEITPPGRPGPETILA